MKQRKNILAWILVFALVFFLLWEPVLSMFSIGHYTIISNSMKHRDRSHGSQVRAFYSARGTDRLIFGDGFQTGDIIVTRSNAAIGDYHPGDVVAFSRPNYSLIVIHRMMQVNATHFVALGDKYIGDSMLPFPSAAMPGYDNSYPARNITTLNMEELGVRELRGKAMFRIPYLGMPEIIFLCMENRNCRFKDCLFQGQCSLGTEYSYAG